MIDDWDNDNNYQEPVNMTTYESDGGRSYGRGRGFIMHNDNDNKTSNFDNVRNSRDGGRGGNNRNGGGGGGRYGKGSNGGYGKGSNGGYRNDNNKEDNCYGNNNRDDSCDYDGNSDTNDNDNRYEKERRGGGRNNRNMDNDRRDDRNGYRNRGGGSGGGGGGGGRGRKRGDDSNNEDGDGQEKPKVEFYIPPDIDTDEKSLFENGVQQGINFEKYDDIEVCVSGENAPSHIESFEEAGLRPYVLSNIRKSKYIKPTPVQKYALPIIMSGRDLMACAQTGSGKTAAFVVPIINTLLESPRENVNSGCAPQVIIISPTRELTIQIYEQVLKFSAGTILKTVIAYGGTSVIHQGNRINAGCDIIVATPGRLIDFIQRKRITLSSIRFLVLDEADRMLDMGFLPDIEKIIDNENMVPVGERQTLMFSATFPDEVQLLASRFLSNYLFLVVGIVGGACTDVEQNFYEVTKYKKLGMLKEVIDKEIANGRQQGTLVFVEMKRTADFIAAFLSENNFPTTSIHGDRLQREREEALRDFRSGRMSILVGTAVAGRGLDIRNVSHVINYDLPQGIDEYVHRIGRTGRVGNRGKATSFFDPEVDNPLVSDLVKILKQADQPIPDWLLSASDNNRSYASGMSTFGAEDIRNFGEEGNGVPYDKSAYNNTVEPEESW
ncbi:hypothetical protein M0804_010297 [Polistes exclamans]|nr:hypothetical protein M0804_010297 [Polistes exclamans]